MSSEKKLASEKKLSVRKNCLMRKGYNLRGEVWVYLSYMGPNLVGKIFSKSANFLLKVGFEQEVAGCAPRLITPAKQLRQNYSKSGGPTKGNCAHQR